MKAILIISLFPLLCFANGGGWISSGGESLIYARNPWFVKNTEVVNYCLQMDEASFSVSKVEVEKIIQDSFQFWKDEFKKNSSSENKVGFTKIATQKFIQSENCDKVSLVFKFGYKLLDKEEIAYLVDPKKYIGVTIRKTYSLEKLQGTGVIYITADKGADSYSNNGQLIFEAWKSKTLLRYAIIHEIGHFFGIPHVGSGIMSEIFMTVLLNKHMTKEYETSYQLSFLNPQSNFEVCRNSNSFNPDFFMVAKDSLCLKFEVQEGGSWKALSKQSSGQYDEIGTVQITAMDQSPYSLKPAVIVQLPEEQKVFSALESIAGPFLIGGLFSETSYTGVFRPKNSVKAYPLHMTLSSETISFVGTVNNRQMTVMNFSSLSFMKAVLP